MKQVIRGAAVIGILLPAMASTAEGRRSCEGCWVVDEYEYVLQNEYCVGFPHYWYAQLWKVRHTECEDPNPDPSCLVEPHCYVQELGCAADFTAECENLIEN
ncbi:MAG: hypothetical protein WEB88_02660 [Gemmatimonadota bacterium]